MWWETNGVLEYKTQLKFTKMIWTNMIFIHNHHLILLHHDLHHHHHLHVDDEFFSKPHAFFFHAWQRESLACPVYPHWLPRSPLSAHHCWCKRALGWTKPGQETNHSLVAMDTLGGWWTYVEGLQVARPGRWAWTCQSLATLPPSGRPDTTPKFWALAWPQLRGRVAVLPCNPFARSVPNAYLAFSNCFARP